MSLQTKLIAGLAGIGATFVTLVWAVTALIGATITVRASELTDSAREIGELSSVQMLSVAVLAVTAALITVCGYVVLLQREERKMAIQMALAAEFCAANKARVASLLSAGGKLEN